MPVLPPTVIRTSPLEDTTGQGQIKDIEATITLAEKELGSANVERIMSSYQQRIMDFWTFLNVMKGRYEQATFQEKRNALEVLGVRALGVNPKTIRFYRRNGTITNYKYEPFLLIHREEIVKLQQKGFLQRNTEEIVRKRVEITYSPHFILGEKGTAVPDSLQTRRYINVSVCCTPCTL